MPAKQTKSLASSMTKSTPLIILANATDTKAPAAMIARRLENLGYTVNQRSIPDAFGDDIEGPQRLLLIWSRGAAASLECAPKRHAGKFSVVQLASAPSPAKLRSLSVRLPRGGDEKAWRLLAEGPRTVATADAASCRVAMAPAREVTAPVLKSRGGLVMALVVAALAAAAIAAFVTQGQGLDLLRSLAS